LTAAHAGFQLSTSNATLGLVPSRVQTIRRVSTNNRCVCVADHGTAAATNLIQGQTNRRAVHALLVDWHNAEFRRRKNFFIIVGINLLL